MEADNVQKHSKLQPLIAEDIERQKLFTSNAEAVIKSYRLYKPDTFLLTRMMEEPHDFEIHELYGDNIVLDIAEQFQRGITQYQERNSKLFMSFIKMLFMMFSENQKLSCSRRLVIEWQRMAKMADYSTYFESISTNFHDCLNAALNVIFYADVPEDHVDAVKDEMRWAILISPSVVVFQLLYTCIHKPKIIPAILMLLRTVPYLFYEKDLIVWHRKTDLDGHEPLLNVILRRVIFDARSYVSENEHWEGLDALALALTKRVPTEKGPLMDQHSLLDLALNELYSKNRSPMKSVEILTRIASRILNTENPKELLYTYAGSMTTQPAKLLFLTPTIIDLILDYFAEYDGKSKEIIANLRIMLRSIGERIQHANVEFDVETREHIFGKQMPWYVEFSISRWFSSALGIVTKRVPPAIFYALSVDEVSYELRDDKQDCSGVLAEDFLCAIVELGLFDVDGAIEVLESKLAIDFDHVNVVETLQRAIQENYGKKCVLGGAESWEIGAFVQLILRYVAPDQTDFDVNSLLQLLPKEEPQPVIVNVPFDSQVKSETVRALIQPGPAKWNAEPFDPRTSWRRIRRVHKERLRRAAEIQRKVNERYAKMSEELRDQWITEGVIIPNQGRPWAAGYMRQSFAGDMPDYDDHEDDSGDEEHHYGEPESVNRHERNVLAKALRHRRRR